MRSLWRTSLWLQWHPTPVLLPGKSHGRRSLVGCSPWGLEESDTTERLHFHFSLSCIGERNGNPFQCSCLETPKDREPGRLPSMGSHRVGHNWSDLAAAAAASDKWTGRSLRAERKGAGGTEPSGGAVEPLHQPSLCSPPYSLAGRSPWGRKESDTTERLSTAQHYSPQIQTVLGGHVLEQRAPRGADRKSLSWAARISRRGIPAAIFESPTGTSAPLCVVRLRQSFWAPFGWRWRGTRHVTQPSTPRSTSQWHVPVCFETKCLSLPCLFV